MPNRTRDFAEPRRIQSRGTLAQPGLSLPKLPPREGVRFRAHIPAQDPVNPHPPPPRPETPLRTITNKELSDSLALNL